MKKWPFVALLVVGATVLGATVLREPIARASQVVDANIIGPLDEQGNVKVHEQGALQVASSSSNPLWVKAADNPAFEPYNEHIFFFHDAPGSLCQERPVPQGKRLVLETVSARFSSPQNEIAQASFGVLRTTDGATFLDQDYEIPLTYQGESGITFTHRFSGSESVRVYAGPSDPPRQAEGTSFTLRGCITRASSGGALNMQFSGYLVEVD
jgi:hypothetical protein